MKIELLNLRDEILQWCANNKTGKECLVILSAGNDNASEIYMKNKINTGVKLGIETIHIRCDSPEELKNRVYECNASNHVTGIIIQLPLPQEYDKEYFINLIDPRKDVDMLTNVNKAKMFLGKTQLLPATASGVLYTIDNIIGLKNITGYDVCLIGRSDLVNIPLQDTFRNLDCTVTVCHSKTKCLEEKVAMADIIVSAAGKHGLINSHNISAKNKLILDVSINRIDGKIKGDVTDDVYDCVDTTSNPKGLGALTVPMLFKNLILFCKEDVL